MTKGRALVPMKSGRTFVCAATDKPGPCPLLGWVEGIGHATGYYADSVDLLPPPPRKVKVTGTITFDENGREKIASIGYSPGLDLRRPRPSAITFTGEYEEPWS